MTGDAVAPAATMDRNLSAVSAAHRSRNFAVALNLVPYRIRHGVLERLHVVRARQRWPTRLPNLQ